MINQLFLIGKIKRLPVLDKIKEENNFIIEVKRNYKNVDGVFESDIFKCYLWVSVGKKVAFNCVEGDVVAIKGRLVNEDDKYKIIADQVMILNKGVENRVSINK